MKRSTLRDAAAVAAILCLLSASADAAVTLIAEPSSSTASSSFAGDVATWGPQNLYDVTLTEADLNAPLAGGTDYAGNGEAPHVVVYSHAAPVTFNGVAYAQRGAGLDPLADKVPSVDFWVTDTDPGAASLTLPILSDPIGGSATGLSVEGGFLQAYDLGASLTGQYVVMRLNGGGTQNPGGGELRLLSGDIPTIPEPATVTLLAMSGIVLLRRRR